MGSQMCRFDRRPPLRALWVCLVCFSSVAEAVAAQAHRTPRAGEAFTGSLFGKPLHVSERDRRKVSAISLGLLWIPDGPEERTVLPAGALFLWRNGRDDGGRLRAVLSGLYNDVRYNTGRRPFGRVEGVLTFENVTLPFDRSEYVEGRRIAEEELEWHSIRIGVGVGYRAALAPRHQDNAFEAALSYEPGVLLFRRGDETAQDFLVPGNAYEGRFHLRLRADALERNILELPHEGFAAGLDGLHGHRSGWRDWGGRLSGNQSRRAGRNWHAWSAYAIAARAVPFVPDERHRLLLSLYGGTGSHLDRFSAFRLGGGSNGGDWEVLAHPVLPGAAFEEFFSRRYGLAALEYRYEVLFFLYLQLRGSLAWVDRARFTPAGGIENHVDPMHSWTVSVTSGFLWDSSIEIGWSHNSGVLRQKSGRCEIRRRGFVLFLDETAVEIRTSIGRDRAGQPQLLIRVPGRA